MEVSFSQQVLQMTRTDTRVYQKGKQNTFFWEMNEINLYYLDEGLDAKIS